MRLVIIAFVAGVGWLQYQPSLPPVWPFGLLALLTCLLTRPLPRLRWLLLAIAATALGVAYADWRAETRLAEWLPHELELQTLQVEGVVASLPQSTRYGPRLRFAVRQAPAGVPPLILLSDYARPATHWQAGQYWKIGVRLKRPHGSANPGGFNYEGWLLSEGIGATGSIDKHDRILLDPSDGSAASLLHQTRTALAAHIRHALANRPYAEVVVALVVGEQSGIPQSQWQLFRSTGITHLVSISGLHVTLVAGLLGGWVGWLWRRSSKLTLYLPARKAALIAGVMAALAYSLLAGFAIPTQRTAFMLAVAAIAMLSSRSLAVSTIWVLALGTTVALDPWAVLSAGFWLSYLTVGAMLWALSGQLGEARGWRAKLHQWGAVQWAATLGSLPLLLVLFQQLPLTSPLANAVAIPLVSTVATPLALLGSLDPSGVLLRLAHGVLQVTFWLIGPLASPDLVWTQAAPPGWLLLPSAIAIGLLLLPRGIPGKLAGCALLLPLLAPNQATLPAGTYRATLYDVGQGLSVLIETAQHRLLFDTGPEGSGSRVVPAALRAAGVRQLDTLLLSHDDGDHIGAAIAVLTEVTAQRIAGVPPHADQLAMPLSLPPVTPCLAGQAWVWDGIRFELLGPPADQAATASDNAKSCVLRVSGPGGSLLIPADIGKAEEAGLLAVGAPLQADILVLPHHGSAASSSPEFVAAVAPKLAVATAGYLNTFHHPRADVISRYQAAGAGVWRSDRDGAVVVLFDQSGWQAERWRPAHRRYWFDALDGDSRMVATAVLPLPR